MSKLKKASTTIAATLLSTIVTNLTTSNQYAASFIIGTAFKDKYDEMKIPRKVLSRSLEDAGTMIENLFPWTPSGIFMASTLGVSVFEYVPFQFLSLINIAIAFIFAFTGIACFLPKKSSVDEKKQ
jgi:NhaC family Na+:H+ antiporter